MSIHRCAPERALQLEDGYGKACATKTLVGGRGFI
ncbi:hypothetical protein LMG28690_05480 [Paraburkholderia caffeinilytica]|nr:hypothetical protein LMG28690_05480 [Paraburkholderia caffeinilytica]